MNKQIINVGAMLRAGHRAPECWRGAWVSIVAAPNVSFMRNPENPSVLLYRVARGGDFAWALYVVQSYGQKHVIVIHGALRFGDQILGAGQSTTVEIGYKQQMREHFDHLQPPENCYFLVM